MRYIRSYYLKDPHRVHYRVVIIFSFVIRLLLSLSQWGLLHPDEVYQSLEVAHRLVYGSGDIPPEFQAEDQIYDDVSGYNAIRSFIFPLIFAVIMLVGRSFDMDYFTVVLPTIKVFLAINSVLLLPIVYKLTFELTEDRETSLYAVVFTGLWFRIIEMTTRSLINTFFLPYLFYGIVVVLRSLKRDRISIKDLVIVGLCLGLVSYVRIDLGIIIFAFFLATFSLRHWIKYILYVLTSFLFWIVGALVDDYMYQTVEFFSVPLKWFRFNIIEHYSDIFGVSSPFFYILQLLIGDLLIILLLPTLFTAYNHWKDNNMHEFFIADDQRREGFAILLKVSVMVWLVYSYPVPEFQKFSISPFQLPIVFTKSHKEIRFIIGGLVVVMLLIATNIKEMVAFLAKMIENSARIDKVILNHFPWKNNYPKPEMRRKLTGLFLIWFIIGGMSVINAQFRSYDDRGEDINLALMYVGQQESVESVLVMEVWYRFGQYTYSHLDKNVTIYWVYFETDQHTAISLQTIDHFLNELDGDDRYLIIDQQQYPDDYFIYDELDSLNFTVVKNIGSVDVFKS